MVVWLAISFFFGVSGAFRTLDAVKSSFCNIINILSFLPKRKQGMYTAITDPLSKKDSEDAKAGILQVAKNMGKAGELKIEDILSSDDDMIE